MQFLLPIASLLGIEVEELIERFKQNAMAFSAVALFVVIGAVFLLVALNAWLTTHWGPIFAPLAIAGAALLIALIVYAVQAMNEAAAKRRELERQRAADKTALVTTAAITALPMLLKSDLMRRVGIPLGGALAAAYLLAKPTGSRHRDPEDTPEA
jgi:fatty acid desaturase